MLSTHSLRQLEDKIVMHLTGQSWIYSHFSPLAFYLGRRLPPNLVHPKERLEFIILESFGKKITG